MPDYAPAHELLGFFEMVQGEHLAVAGQQLLLAIQLAPQNHSYLISLAQFQIQTRNSAAARQTLQSLMRPDEAPELRTQAQDLLNQLNHFSRSAS
jgi:thioredoxin-like negative regulator of GroEL